MKTPVQIVGQPTSFAFTEENLKRANEIIAKYPEGRQASAVVPILYIAQQQHANWLPRVAMEVVADMLGMPHIKVYEVATFYTMFNLQPVGQHFVQICTTTPCWLRGSDDIVKACKEKIGIGPGQMTPDGKFSVVEVECLGACVNAPMVQINNDYYEDLTLELMKDLLGDLAEGKKPSVGSQTGRRGSCAQNGPTSLQGKAKANA